MNEFELIQRLTNDLPQSSCDGARGVGDDCAVIDHVDRQLLVSADAFIEDVHFALAHIDPHALGARLINAAMSDIAAMGATPRACTVALGVPRGFGTRRCEELFAGIKNALASMGASLIGGDTTASAQLMISVTVFGECEEGKAILRSTAKPGDHIYVTGTLGDAALGLACLDSGLNGTAEDYFISRYRSPTARIKAGRWLAETGMVSSMIDISDGLVADVDHLAESSKTGYEIKVTTLPTAHRFDDVARRLGADRYALALSGGDDYEVAFTVHERMGEQFERMLHDHSLPFDHAITRIGTMLSDMKRRVVLDESDAPLSLARSGYTHAIEED